MRSALALISHNRQNKAHHRGTQSLTCVVDERSAKSGDMDPGCIRQPGFPLKSNYYFLAHLQCSLKFACKNFWLAFVIYSPARVEIFCPRPPRTRKIKPAPHPHEFEKSCPHPPRTRTLLTRTHPATIPTHFALYRSQTRTSPKTTKNV